MKETFTNPVVPFGADPWVIRYRDEYWYCHAGRGNTIWVDRTKHLQNLGMAKAHKVYTAPETGPFAKELWAPELHRIGNQWVIYVAADDGDNFNHRMIALVSDDELPTGTFRFAGKVELPGDAWAIDMTILDLGQQGRFALWSGWEGRQNVAQHIYIAKMTGTNTCTGPRVKLSSPDFPWETAGSGGKDKLPTINEGPQVLQKNGQVHVIYSAAGSWCDEYCLGRLTLTKGADPMKLASWAKHSEPVFRKTDKVFGPGHCSFVDDAKGQTWIVYHSARSKGAGWDRQVSMQPVAWNGNTPVFGTPVAPGTPLEIPVN
jgi:GH43 family beta-xylosidase